MKTKNSTNGAEAVPNDDLLAAVRSKMIVAAAAQINKSLPVNYYEARKMLNILGIPTASLAQTKRKKTVIVLRTDSSENVTRAFAC